MNLLLEMQLTGLDWAILIGFILLIMGIGISYSRESSSNLQSYFLGGRKLPWYIAGASMVATTFAADTPLAVAQLTGDSGISGNWLWWNFLMGGLLTTFFFARLWRRSGVLTEAEFVELRYSGKAARFLRGFKAVYLGVFFNVLIIGWVSQAMIDILGVFLGVDPQTAMLLTLGLMIITALYSALAGLKGIAVTDSIQFLIALGSCIALAILVVNHESVGGIAALKEKLPEGSLQFFPSIDVGKDSGAAADINPGSSMPIGSALSIALGAFLVRVCMQWWSAWYPGSEPGGGGYVAQRIMSARSEKDGVWASLFFNMAHYTLRPWPWILVGLAAITLYTPKQNFPNDDLAFEIQKQVQDGANFSWFLKKEADLQKQYSDEKVMLAKDPQAHPSVLQNEARYAQIVSLARQLQERPSDDAFLRAVSYEDNKQLGFVYAMTDFLPPGLAGLLLAAFVAAFMSTISTQLNWGASYVVNDLYLRFMAKDIKDERRQVWVSRMCTLLLMLLALLVASQFSSVSEVWSFLIEAGAGMGLVLILRWYWWRINAWSELVATIGSLVFFAISQYLNLEFPNSFLFIVLCTTLLWILVTIFTPADDAEHLRNFYQRVRPPGWWKIASNDALLDQEGSEQNRGASSALLFLGWISAVVLIYSVLFASGGIILGTGSLWWLLSAAVSGIALVLLVRRFHLFD